MRWIAGWIGGGLFAVVGSFVVATRVTAADAGHGSWAGLSFVVFWLAGLAVGIGASSAAAAWRSLLVASSLVLLALPVADALARREAAAPAAAVGAVDRDAEGHLALGLGVVLLLAGLAVGRPGRRP